MKIIKNAAFTAFAAALVLVPAASLVHAQGQMYIAISDNSYSNSSVTLPVGTTITWTNIGLNSHTVTADNGSFDSGTMGRNQTFVQTFNTPGVFTYHDRFYGASGGVGMFATIIIGDGTGGGTFPVCSPATQNSNVNGPVQFSVTGGSGSYTWSAPNGSPNFGSGSFFTTAFLLSGTQTVTVSSNGFTSQCTVNVNNFNSGNLSCFSSVSVVNPNTSVNFNASGGNGNYTWNTANGNPSSGSGSNFSTQFYGYGTQTVTVNSNGQTAQCTVNVQQNGNNIGGAPVCSPSTQSVKVGDFVSFSATGGNGNYVWSSPSLTITNPTGSTFGARFAAAGVQTITLTSNGQSSQCIVNVTSGQVLGASDIVTGPEDGALWAIVIGLLAAILAYGTAFTKYPRKIWKSIAGK